MCVYYYSEKKLLQWINDCAILCCWSYNNRPHCVFILWVRFLIVWQYNYEINLRFWSLGNDERFKQVSIGLMVFLPCWIFFARQSDPKLCEVQQIWQSFCFVLDVVISILLWQKKKIDHPSSWAKLSQIGLSLMRWSYQCVISFWYHGVWEMMSWQCNAYSYQCIAVNSTLSGSRGAIFIVDLSVHWWV